MSSLSDRVQPFLDRLEMVRSRGNGQWSARCPSHEDRDPSLGIAVGDDGRVLIYCRAGCSPLDVITAVGMQWVDLFPPKAMLYRPIRQSKDVIHEKAVLSICAADRAAGKRLSKADKARELEAWKRVRGGG